MSSPSTTSIVASSSDGVSDESIRAGLALAVNASALSTVREIHTGWSGGGGAFVAARNLTRSLSELRTELKGGSGMGGGIQWVAIVVVQKSLLFSSVTQVRFT